MAKKKIEAGSTEEAVTTPASCGCCDQKTVLNPFDYNNKVRNDLIVKTRGLVNYMNAKNLEDVKVLDVWCEPSPDFGREECRVDEEDLQYMQAVFNEASRILRDEVYGVVHTHSGDIMLSVVTGYELTTNGLYVITKTVDPVIFSLSYEEKVFNVKDDNIVFLGPVKVIEEEKPFLGEDNRLFVEH